MEKYLLILTITIIFMIILQQSSFSEYYKTQNNIISINNGLNFTFKDTNLFNNDKSIEYNLEKNELIVIDDSNKYTKTIY